MTPQQLQITKSVHQQYQEWWAKVSNGHEPPVQVEECQRAFYCGFQALMFSMLAIADDSVPSEHGEAALEWWKSELEVYFAMLGAAGTPNDERH